MRFKALLYIFGSALVLLIVVMLALRFVDHEYSILVVPLDSRPVNTQHLQLLGRIGRVEVLVPPGELMDHFTQPANSEAVLQWLGEQGQDADSLVVHVNAAIAGGLIASRHPEAYEGWQQRLGELAAVLDRYRDQESYCILVLPRLLPTQFNNPGWEYRNQLAEYAQLADKLAQGLGSSSDRQRLQQLKSHLPDTVLQAYEHVYQVNRELGEALIALVQEGVLDHLVLTLDDAAPYGLANMHQRALAQLAVELEVSDRVHILQGADEVDMLTLARIIAAHYEQSPEFKVVFEAKEDRTLVLPFEAKPLEELVQSKVNYAGGRIRQEAADVLYLHTRAGWDENYASLFEPGKEIGVVDVAYINRGDPVFASNLLGVVPVQRIASYAGWNTAGNSLGSVIAHLAVKQSAWQKGRMRGEELVEAVQAEIEYRFLHIADAVCYLGETKAELAKWVRDQGMDPYGLSAAQVEFVEAELQRLLQPRLEELKQHFLGQWQFEVGRKEQIVTVRDIQWQIDLPWPRIFEVRIIPRAIIGDR